MRVYAIYIHDTKAEPFTDWILDGKKTIETRTRNVLYNMLGNRVLIIRTRSGHDAEIVGSVFINDYGFYTKEQLDEMRDKTCIAPESRFNECKAGKWCYFLKNPHRYEKPTLLKELTVYKRTMSFAQVNWPIK